MEDWFRFEWYDAVFVFHGCSSELFKPENSKGRDVIPQWQTVVPAGSQGGGRVQCIKGGGAQGGGWGRRAAL